MCLSQAEDGMRVRIVTGVQTCPLPISLSVASAIVGVAMVVSSVKVRLALAVLPAVSRSEVGRASCRGRVGVSVGAVSLKKKKVGRGVAARRAWQSVDGPCVVEVLAFGQ